MPNGPTFALPDELKRRMRFFPESDPDERAALMAEARALVQEQGTDALAAGLGAVTRLKWFLAAEGREDELLALIRHDREFPSAYAIRGWLRPRPDIPGVHTASVPDAVARLRPNSEIPLRAKATDLEWDGERLRIRGYAFLRNTPVAERPRLPRLAWLSRKGDRRRIRLPVRTRPEPLATVDSRQPLHSFDHAGIELVVDPARLAGGEGTWNLTLAIPGPGGLRRGGLAPGQTGRAGHPLVAELGEDRQLVCDAAKDRLRVSVRRVRARLEACTPDEGSDGGVRLTVSASGAADRLRLTGDGDPVEVPLDPEEPRDGDGRHRWSALVTGETVGAGGPGEGARRMRLDLVGPDGTVRRLAAAPRLAGCQAATDGGRELAVTSDKAGYAELAERPAQPVVDDISWTGEGELVLSGSYTAGDRPAALVLRHGERFEEVRVPFEADGGRFTATVAPERVSSLGGTLPLKRGRWYPRLRPEGARDHTGDAQVRIRTDLLDRVPMELAGRRRAFRLDRRFHDLLFIASEPSVPTEARGLYNQRRLRVDHTARAKAEPLWDAVLYNNFGGRQYSDSPRAVHEELARRGTDLEHLWTVNDQQVEVPPGVRAVEWKSPEWYEALARCRYIVTNTNGGFGEWFGKRDGQVVVQTWHGTPLKRIGADLLGTPKANPTYIASLPHQSAQWDVFVSPNTFATPVLKNAFAYEGAMLESGYPRNDIFYAPEEERRKRAEATRALLGLPEGKRVVLYAPTLRDDQRHGGKRFKLDLRIDLEAAERALGEDHVFLVRKHGRVVDAVPGDGGGFVHDVSAYPDIADLFLVSDVLITDYSSSFFDFAHSGRPMLFFTYDLEHYRDELRGFYFDLTERAPGPLLRTSEELVEAIRDLDGVAERYRDRYEAFVRDFCDPARGGAAAQVVDRMLELGGGPSGTSGGPDSSRKGDA